MSRRASLVPGCTLVAGVLAVSIAAVFATAAFAHPHAPGDPFTDVADTLVAGSPRLAPFTASHTRWKLTEWIAGVETPGGSVEQRVSRADTPAGRQWCVAIERRGPGETSPAVDSIFVTAGAPIPVYWRFHFIGGSLALRFNGRVVSGEYWGAWRLYADAADTLGHAAFPEPLARVLLSRLDYRAGLAVALALFDPNPAAASSEYRLAVQVVGETRLDARGRERRCWLLALAEDRPRGMSRTVWIDRATREVLREEVRDASANLVEVLEVE